MTRKYQSASKEATSWWLDASVLRREQVSVEPDPHKRALNLHIKSVFEMNNDELCDFLHH